MWVINEASSELDPDGRRLLCVGLTTAEWIRESGDEARPADATTFVWVILRDLALIEIGLRPHSAVSEAECLEQIPHLLRAIREGGERVEPAALRGVRVRGT